LLYNRYSQWRFANARAEGVSYVQSLIAKVIYSKQKKCDIVLSVSSSVFNNLEVTGNSIQCLACNIRPKGSSDNSKNLSPTVEARNQVKIHLK
jgi:hypothetical protein